VKGERRVRIGVSREGSRVVVAMRADDGQAVTANFARAQAGSLAACVTVATGGDEDAELELELRALLDTNTGAKP
jgi:hypothetical protein